MGKETSIPNREVITPAPSMARKNGTLARAIRMAAVYAPTHKKPA